MKAISLEEIKQWATDDFACGKTFDSDDFNEFCHILKDAHPGLKISNKDFEKYWDCYWDTIEECQSRSDEDENEDEYEDEDEELDESTDNTNVLNEGAGAGYNVNGDLSDIKINKINKIDKFTSINFLDTELEFATIDVDADAIFDGTASSYYYGDEIHNAPIKLTTLYVNPNLLHNLGLEEFEYDKITIEDLQGQINSTINGVKSDVIGGGWTHTTFDGNVESHSIDDDYKSFIDGLKFYFTDKDTVEYIDKAVSGELEENDEYSDDNTYDRRAVEKEYGLEDGELDGWSIRDAEKKIGCEEGELDRFLFESVSKDAQEVVNPTYAKALKDFEETDKKKEDALKVPEHNEGPKENKVKPTPEMKKLHLDESLFDESIVNQMYDSNLQRSSYNPRENEEKIYYLIDNGVLEWETVAAAALRWMSDDDVGELAANYGWFDVYEDDDELNEDVETILNKDLVGKKVKCKKGYTHPNMGKEFVKGRTYKVTEENGKFFVGNILIDQDFFKEHFTLQSLDEDVATKLSSDGRQRPTSYTKKTFTKPLSLQVYDALTDLGYDVFGSTGNYAFSISKHYEKNLQRAKDYLDSKNIKYKVDNFNNKRFELKIILPNEDDRVDNYFKNVDYKEKRAVNENLMVTSDFSTYKPWAGAVDTYSRIEDEGKLDELEAILEDMYPNGISMTALNDLLWMEKDYVFNWLGITDDEDEDDQEFDESLNNKSNKKSK